MQLIDLSVALDGDVLADPPMAQPKISYLGHRQTFARLGRFFPGLAPEDLPDGETWAIEKVELTTHNGGVRTRPRADALIEEMFALFPRLRERAAQQAGSLSGGEQQILAIARALMSEPKALMLDKSTLGLAPIIVRQLRDLVHALKSRGTSVLLAEQNAEMALSCTDRAYVLEGGNVAKEGLSSALVEDPAVRAAYLGLG